MSHREHTPVAGPEQPAGYSWLFHNFFSRNKWNMCRETQGLTETLDAILWRVQRVGCQWMRCSTRAKIKARGKGHLGEDKMGRFY